jgi:hypothetical protein
VYLRATLERAKGSESVRYLQLAHKERDEREVSVGRGDRQLRPRRPARPEALVRLVRSIQRFLGGEETLRAPACAPGPSQSNETERRSSRCAPPYAARSRSRQKQLTSNHNWGNSLRELAPALLAEPGVGVITAAQLLTSWSHPARFRSDGAVASLAGAARSPPPLARSSVTA